ncbi:sensor histidine kinase [Streptococcus ovuberis]|uniref:histidine kinase n=1 Tax=Streptococcus ovuberis TaxID=1936207 RepID=A0A7X6MZV6_9STRE|nr:sensor histidine kinase [Streptococcus ovuberis]NKZ19642.1 sensor histidine kinase [Streptococcus ovuberis]
MFRAFEKGDPLYYVGLIFMVFPLGGVLWFGYPIWTLIPSLMFAIAYMAIIHIKNDYRKTIACLWFYLLSYIVWMSCFIEGSMMWFFFFLVNLLVWRFGDGVKSYRFISFLMGMAYVVANGLLRSDNPSVQIMVILIPIFILAMYFTQHQSQVEEEMKQELYKQNETINLLAAENERNRIGRDLHDTLGHTFAMLSVKTELALKQLDKENLTAVQKELQDINQISKTSMKEVRELINNLKFRTVTEELSAIQEMFALSGVTLTVANDLITDQLSPVIQSTMTMILRELATNIIKHADASSCQIQLYREKGLVIEVIDDGCGFAQLTGQELHSIRERLQLVKGTVEIVSQGQPTHIRVILEEGSTSL